MRFCFENNVLNGDLRQLTCGGAAVPLQPQVFDLLLYLVAQRARVVSKGDLISQIWRDRIVSDSAKRTATFSDPPLAGQGNRIWISRGRPRVCSASPACETFA